MQYFLTVVLQCSLGLVRCCFLAVVLYSVACPAAVPSDSSLTVFRSHLAVPSDPEVPSHSRLRVLLGSYPTVPSDSCLAVFLGTCPAVPSAIPRVCTQCCLKVVLQCFLAVVYGVVHPGMSSPDLEAMTSEEIRIWLEGQGIPEEFSEKFEGIYVYNIIYIYIFFLHTSVFYI